MSDPKSRPMSHLSAGQAMAVARRVATDAMPYFAAGILSMVPRERPGLGTMGITSENILLYDPETVRGWSPMQAGTVILHEYLHRFFQHDKRLTKLQALGQLDSSDEDRALWNSAADCEINDNLEDGGYVLPKGPKGEEPTTPRALKLPEHLTAEEYVLLLKQERAKQKDKNPPPPGQSPPPPSGGCAGCGHCGSGAGRPLPDEPQNDPEGRPDIDQEAQRKADAENIKGYAGGAGRGKLPTGLRRFADAMLTPARIPWQTKLARMARLAIAYRPGAVDYTRSRPSRRQSAMTALEDQPILPAFRAPIVNVAVVADTSGSMGEAQLQKILGECEGIFRAQAGARVTFCACDAAVHTLTRVRTAAEVRRGFKGGGGTDFRPAFEALAKSKPRPEIVVFATDGYGPAPAAPPTGMKVIWLIVDGRNECPWGEVIDIGRSDE